MQLLEMLELRCREKHKDNLPGPAEVQDIKHHLSRYRHHGPAEDRQMLD